MGNWQNPGPNSGYYCPPCDNRPLSPVVRMSGSAAAFTYRKVCPTCGGLLVRVDRVTEHGKETT